MGATVDGRSPSPGEAAELSRLASWLTAAAVGFTLFYAVLALAQSSLRLALIAALTAALTALFALIRRTVTTAPQRSAAAIAAGILALEVTSVVILPASWPALCVAVLLAAVIALRFVQGSPLRWLLWASAAALLFGAGAGQLLPHTPLQTWLAFLVVSGSSVIAAAFTFVIVWQLRSSLQGNLEAALAVQARLEEAERRSAFLARTGQVLAEAVEPEDVLRKLAQLVVPELADWCTAVLGGPTEHSHRVAALHRDPEKVALVEEYLHRFPPDQNPATIHFASLAAGQAVWLPTVAESDLRGTAHDSTHLDLLRRLGTGSVGLLPLLARGRVLGVLSIMRADAARPFDASEMKLIEALVDRGALALDNARLLQEARRQQERRGFLAQAGLELGETLDPQPTLATLARMAVPRLADWCIVDAVEGDEIVRMAVEHRDPSMAASADALRRLAPRRKGARPALEKALASGRSILMRVVSGHSVDEAVLEPQLRKVAAEVGARSAMFVPLRARGRTIGVSLFISTDASRLFDEDDLALAEELALRAALAVDNARLFRETQLALGMREDVLAVVSHDLNNLLQPILAAGGLLARRLPDSGNASPGRQARLIERSATRMARMIRDLLDAASLDSGRPSLQLVEYDAGAIAREAAEIFAPAAEAKGLAFEISLPDGPIPVRCDRGRVAQILANLLSNAVKFTASGSVTLSVRREASECLFEVRDTGPGIDPGQAGSVFDRFWRGRPSQTPGAGLGLYIAKGLVEAHGGRIWVESRMGRGSAFFFALPL